MSYPITPDPSIHQLPPAIAQKQQQQNAAEIEASAGRIVQALLNALLKILTGGLLGTGATSSGQSVSFFSNLFTNFFSLVGIANPASLLATVETDVFNSISTIENFASNILAPTGTFNLASDAESFLTSLWSALTGVTATAPKSSSEVASAAANVVTMTMNHSDTLSIRDNQAAFLGNGPTEESVFPLTHLTGSPVYHNLTPTNALMGFIRIGQAVNKDAVSWLGQTTAGLTGFYVSVYKLDTTTGDLTLVHESTDQLSSVSNLLSWNTYVIPAMSTVAASPGEVYGIELSVTGAGTYTVVGIDQTWMPDHPTNFPAQLGAHRNNANSAVAPSTISAGSVVYAAHVPWFGFGVDAGNGFHAPVSLSFSTAGSGSYTIPTWAKFIDVIIMGGGGSGSSGGPFGQNGQGGTGGVWNAVTAEIGVDIPLTTTTISYTVGAGGIANPSGFTGTAGSSTTTSATGWAGITATGGVAGNTIGYIPVDSSGAGNETFAGTTYYGGGIQSTPYAAGISPGGGGAGGGQYGGIGANGAAGVVWFVARAS